MINRWSVSCVKQRTLLLLTNNDENATCGDSPEDIKKVRWALAVGAAAFAAAPTACGAGGSFAGLSRKCAGDGGIESKKDYLRM